LFRHYKFSDCDRIGLIATRGEILSVEHSSVCHPNSRRESEIMLRLISQQARSQASGLWLDDIRDNDLDGVALLDRAGAANRCGIDVEVQPALLARHAERYAPTAYQ
jgi:hypothetical protein